MAITSSRCSHCFEVAKDAVPCNGCNASVCRGCRTSCFRKPSKKAPAKRTRKARKVLAPAPKAVAPKPQKPAPAPVSASSKPGTKRNDWSLAGVLLAAAVLVRRFGYRKTSQDNSTKEGVQNAISCGFEYELVDMDTVQTAREWYREDILGSDSEFAEKLRAACERARGRGEVRDRDLGFIVSMIPCSQRWKQRQEQASKPQESVVFAGVAGQKGRQTIGPVTVETVREMARWDSWLVKARVQSGPYAGAVVSWFSKEQLPSNAFYADLRAKVKDHNEKYGETQLSLVRLS